MKEVFLITGNKGKLLAAQRVFSKYNIQVKQIKKDYPEIQAKSSLEIARFTVLEAIKEFKVPVIREDHSLFIHALDGFPGPYTNYFDKTMPVKTLIKILSLFEDRSAHMELAAVLALPSGKIYDFVYQVPLKISKNIKGNERNWDKVLMLSSDTRTFSESEEDARLEVWTKNYEEIAKLLSTDKK
ncbi:MAG: hypothetical protein KJ879_00610 [Nanoarchaeota archaeon]|nr:hypothetical protein [Nanoarchaeota archaeon]